MLGTLAGSLFGVLTPLRADWAHRLRDETRPFKGQLEVTAVKVSIDVTEVPPQHSRILGGQKTGRDGRVDNHSCVRLHDTDDLVERAGEVNNLFENVPAPYKVEVRIGIRQVVHAAFVQRNPIDQASGLHRRSRSLDVQRNRLHSDTLDIEAADQLDQMSAISATRIEDCVTNTQVPTGFIKQGVRASWIETYVKALVHVPGSGAVHASEARNILRQHPSTMPHSWPPLSCRLRSLAEQDRFEDIATGPPRRLS